MDMGALFRQNKLLPLSLQGTWGLQLKHMTAPPKDCSSVIAT